MNYWLILLEELTAVGLTLGTVAKQRCFVTSPDLKGFGEGTVDISAASHNKIKRRDKANSDSDGGETKS